MVGTSGIRPSSNRIHTRQIYISCNRGYRSTKRYKQRTICKSDVQHFGISRSPCRQWLCSKQGKRKNRAEYQRNYSYSFRHLLLVRRSKLYWRRRVAAVAAAAAPDNITPREKKRTAPVAPLRYTIDSSYCCARDFDSRAWQLDNSFTFDYFHYKLYCNLARQILNTNTTHNTRICFCSKKQSPRGRYLFPTE